ncbi:DUF1707 domain-containing protein [Planomonospora corallina]|uniref:DUF1707 domain-containing protein n=1 Tax=Planomonospora corallina TaxID=1806052 RepID=A0ABV8IBI0_9ACTN
MSELRRGGGKALLIMSDDPALPIRASDAERDRVITYLGEQAAQGRLTLAELEERMERAATARTLAELQPLISDLPAVPGGTSRRKVIRWLPAVLSGFSRTGRWRAAPRVRAVAVMGGGEIDLRGAELDGGSLTLSATAIMGGFDIYVPDSIDVDVSGFSLMGGHEERGSRRTPRQGAPLVRIRVFTLMGGVDVWRVPAELDAASLKALKRAAKELER